MTTDQVLAKLRREIKALGSQQAWANTHGVSPAYLSDTLRGRRDLGPTILAALGLQRIVTYTTAGE